MLWQNKKKLLRSGVQAGLCHTWSEIPDGPPRASLSVFCANSFASNCQIALLQSTEEVFFSSKECLSSIHAIDQATVPSLDPKQR